MEACCWFKWLTVARLAECPHKISVQSRLGTTISTAYTAGISCGTCGIAKILHLQYRILNYARRCLSDLVQHFFRSHANTSKDRRVSKRVGAGFCFTKLLYEIDKVFREIGLEGHNKFLIVNAE